jgi:hypothetical protein
LLLVREGPTREGSMSATSNDESGSFTLDGGFRIFFISLEGAGVGIGKG